MLNITAAEFVKSAAESRQCLDDDRLQFAFVGRSNVGKSSLINYLTNRKGLAKASSTPGRTRLINYFLINKSFYFVDLPGYGFSKASKEQTFGWDKMIEPYLTNTDKLKMVFVLVDSRLEANPKDKQMIDFLVYYNVPFTVIATKCDKFAKSKLKPTIAKLANGLGLAIGNVIPASTLSNIGKAEILDRINLVLENSEQNGTI